MEHGELTACMNAPARKESAIGSQGSASVPMGGMGWNAKMVSYYWYYQCYRIYNYFNRKIHVLSILFYKKKRKN